MKHLKFAPKKLFHSSQKFCQILLLLSQFSMMMLLICYSLANLNNLVNQCTFLISNPLHLQITFDIGTGQDLTKNWQDVSLGLVHGRSGLSGTLEEVGQTSLPR